MSHAGDESVSVSKPIGAWSLISLLVIIGAVTWTTGAIPLFFERLLLFLVRPQDLRVVAQFRELGPLIFASLSGAIPLAFAIGLHQQRSLGDSGEHAVSNWLQNLQKGNIFFAMVFIIFLEELYARWLFLGLLGGLELLRNQFGIYLLILLGNTSWALFHLYNFEDPAKRHLIRALPQFVIGLFFSLMYLQFGLIGSVLTHCAFNLSILSSDKRQRTDLIDFLLIGVNGILASVGYFLFTKSIGDAAQWLQASPQYKIEGWEYFDYFWFALLLTSSIEFVLDLLFLDKPITELPEASLGRKIYFGSLVVVVTAAVLLGGDWLLGLAIKDIHVRVITLTLVISCLSVGGSMSSATRVFYLSLPTTFIWLFIAKAVGFWGAVGLIGIMSVITIPKKILRDLDT